MTDHPLISALTTAVYTFPTGRPEADGTLSWDKTTAVVVTAEAGGQVGVGWTYGSPAAASVVAEHLAAVLTGRGAFDIAAGWSAMHRKTRNFGTRFSAEIGRPMTPGEPAPEPFPRPENIAEIEARTVFGWTDKRYGDWLSTQWRRQFTGT